MNGNQQIIVSMDDLVPLFRERLAAGQSVRFSPRGVSMLPLLQEGRDSVVLSPLPDELKKYDLVLYRRDDGSYVLHRIVAAGRTYTCIGDNQFTAEPGLRRDQMIAVVTAFSQGDRLVSAQSPMYKIYCRVWHFSRPARHFWRRAKGWLRRHLP